MLRSGRHGVTRRSDVLHASRDRRTYKRDGAAEFTAPEARGAEMHTAKDARVGHFFDGTFKPDEQLELPRASTSEVASNATSSPRSVPEGRSGRRPGQVRSVLTDIPGVRTS